MQCVVNYIKISTMDKVNKYLKNVPTELENFANKQEKSSSFVDFADYLTQLEEDIEHFKKYGTFKTSNNNRNSKTQKSVLVDHSNENIKELKLERISEIETNNVSTAYRDSLKENIDVKIEKPDMPPPQLPVKKMRKPNKESTSSAKSTRSTRSKVIKTEQTRDSDVILQRVEVETIQLTDSDEDNHLETHKKISMKNNNLDGTKNSSRSTRTKARVQERNEIEGSESSSNVKEDDDESDDEETTRTTRTKTRAKEKKKVEETEKRSRSPSTDAEKKSRGTNQQRQTKRKKSDEVSEKETSVYEDAKSYHQNRDTNGKAIVDVPTPMLNETYVAQNRNTNDIAYAPLNQTTVIQKDINTTVTIEKPTFSKFQKENLPTELKDIMTDDEDDNVVVTVPKKQNKTIKKGTKPIFSPFEGSPVKKRVEAFEKLGAEVISEIPVRTTRSKAKPRAKNNEQESKIQEDNEKNSSKEKKNFKLVTPILSNRYMPTYSNSANKALKSYTNESLISTKSASALKAAQQEFKERELRRREKEMEAVKKREALLQIQMEEKKRKREEKQIKAQQLRETLEKNKQKEREQAEKSKEEKYKQTMAEKQEKIKKQQEEAERKRLEAMKKAMEEKRKEEERKRAIEEERLLQEKYREAELKKTFEENRMAKHMEYKKKARNLPRYLREKAPLLPTDDCYDSDHEETGKQKTKVPSWMSKEKMLSTLRSMQFIDKSVDRKYFVMNVTTPDLVDIFETIDPRKLKRTSSAVWRAPPRFTLMPATIEEAGEDC